MSANLLESWSHRGKDICSQKQTDQQTDGQENQKLQVQLQEATRSGHLSCDGGSTDSQNENLWGLCHGKNFLKFFLILTLRTRIDPYSSFLSQMKWAFKIFLTGLSLNEKCFNITYPSSSHQPFCFTSDGEDGAVVMRFTTQSPRLLQDWEQFTGQ